MSSEESSCFESEYEYSDDDESMVDEEANDDGDIHSDSSRPLGLRSMNLPFPPPSRSAAKRKERTYVTTAFENNNRRISIIRARDLESELRNNVSEIVEALGVPPAAAAPLLRQHGWCHQSVLQDYYAAPEKVLKNAGVSLRCSSTQMNEEHPAKIATTRVGECLICMEPLASNDDGSATSLSMPCGHPFCLDCWHDYLVNCIQEEGATCVLTRCPQAGCDEVVTEVEVEAAAPKLMTKFQNYQLRSFIESNPRMRWCPGKGCGLVCVATSKAAVSDPTLLSECVCTACDTQFCFRCGEEPHTPVSCQNLQLWNDKNTNESETANWITANTKTCPKCSARINKDGGCMYVTCRKCNHGFCWMCMGTHHVWQCNAYKGESDDATNRAKNELERYLHYYERYHGHNKGQEFALKQLANLNKEEHESDTKKMDLSSTATGDDEGKGSFPQSVDILKKANQQLLDCRRVLKYSYAFAYYHFVNASSTTTKQQQKERFEHHQGILEGLTEGLSKVTEVPREGIDPQDVTNRTRVIGSFIKNVLEYVDNGMVDVGE